MYRIFFHDDIDGVVSAALYMKHVVKNQPYQLVPVQSHMRGSLIKKSDEANVNTVVLDYEFIDWVHFWADHHHNKTLGSERVVNDKMAYDPSKRSCARLLSECFENQTSYPQVFLDDVDIIDSAGYKCVDDIFTSTKPIMMMRASMDVSGFDKHMLCRTVELLARTTFDFKETCRRMGIDDGYVTTIRDIAIRAKKHMIVQDNVSTIIQKYVDQYPRYAEYFNLPSIRYAIRFSHVDGGKMKVGVGFNMWSKIPNEINIGSVCSEIPEALSGGGHYGVGAAVIKKSSAGEVTDYLISKLGGK